MCLSVFKFVPAEYPTNVFNSKSKYKKLAFVVHVFQIAQNCVISRCCFAEDGKEMVQRIFTHVHSHYSVHLTFCLVTFRLPSPSCSA